MNKKPTTPHEMSAREWYEDHIVVMGYVAAAFFAIDSIILLIIYFSFK